MCEYGGTLFDRNLEVKQEIPESTFQKVVLALVFQPLQEIKHQAPVHSRRQTRPSAYSVFWVSDTYHVDHDYRLGGFYQLLPDISRS